MGKIMRQMQRMRTVKNERGYVSLTEAAATVAVGLTLAAALTPVILQKGNDAKVTRAKSDTAAIQQAIANFVADTGVAPIRGTSGTDIPQPTTLGGATGTSGVTPTNTVLCERSGTSNANDPALVSSVTTGDCFSTSGILGSANGSGTFLNNHLVFDVSGNPSVATGEPASLKYKNGSPPRNWNGPYIKEVLQDPWGHNYVIYTRGLFQALEGSSQPYAWALSAGPNGLLETTELHSSVQGDDIGTLIATFNLPNENFRTTIQ